MLQLLKKTGFELTKKYCEDQSCQVKRQKRDEPRMTGQSLCIDFRSGKILGVGIRL